MLGSNPVTSQLQQFGFKSVDFFGLLHNITNQGGQIIQIVFTWVYLVSVIGGLVGALVIAAGGLFHHNRWKQNGVRILLFSVFAFVAAVFAPGIILGIDKNFIH